MGREVPICKTTDLRVGQMQQFSAEGTDVLVANVNGQYYATGAYCTHYGAPLEKGVLCQARIVCPWHNACFRVTTGEQLEPPGQNSLMDFATRVVGDQIWVTLPDEPQLEKLPDMADFNSERDNRTFIIIGAGAAGSNAAETLREAGYQGRIVVLTAEERLPYDRTELSKSYLQSDGSQGPSLLRAAEFYREHGIEVQTGQVVTGIDTTEKALFLADSSRLTYDQLLIATGTRARSLAVEGASLGNVFTLHHAQDAEHILAAAEQKQTAVVVGGSFISMEAAASLRKHGLEVTVVTPNSVPFKKILGPEIGRFLQARHESEGVQFRTQTKVVAFQGTDQVQSVKLDNGDSLPADLVVVGIGVEPVTDFLQGLPLDEHDGSVLVDEYLQATPDVYAAGDIAKFPSPSTGQPIRIEHWRLAAQHGRIAAHNMVGHRIPYQSIPFFWTGQFDVKLRYVGHAEGWDEIIYHGQPEQGDFLAFYIQAGEIRAIAGCNQDRNIAAISELMRQRQMPSVESLQHQTTIDWVERLSQLGK